ncbi:DUF2589 domain-containing protein [Breznakiella homolactica]|uniref:DUF2589 domain-containing protein n=1 Tax=Breznakiella homolactica TaxID=2798577 RepID=A0A7T7XPH9_9SPIR|nr:DUF2589 domain-containing protein [Breznakiella homolactica]QQO10141.1 DUF2589 domain-containing protein [Breznakiella homolactica]
MAEKNSSRAEQTFSDIIRGMQYAVNTAQETLQDHQFRLMEQYFDSDGNPHMMYIILPDGRRVDFPKIALIPQCLLGIEELEMSFSVAVARAEVKTFVNKAEEVLPPETSRSSFLVAFARRKPSPEPEKNSSKGKTEEPADTDTIEVKIKFKSIPLPEGASRIQDMLNLGIGG